jgi:hypothetical protein
MPATKAAATTKAKRPTSAFLTDEQIEEVAKDTQGNDSFVGLSKLDEGKPHRFRYLGSAVTGYSTWLDVDGKSRPIRWARKPVGEAIPGNIQINKDSGKPSEIKRFVAGFVWDYLKERIRVLNIDQSSILSQLNAFIADAEDYGDPQGYDIKITRKVEKGFTKYTLSASPPKAVSAEIDAAFEALMEGGADLTVLFENGDPFNPEASKEEDEDEETAEEEEEGEGGEDL